MAENKWVTGVITSMTGVLIENTARKLRHGPQIGRMMVWNMCISCQIWICWVSTLNFGSVVILYLENSNPYRSMEGLPTFYHKA